jgi:hypothetical protein
MIQRWRWDSVSSAASALRWRSGFYLHYLALLLYHYAALGIASRDLFLCSLFRSLALREMSDRDDTLVCVA